MSKMGSVAGAAIPFPASAGRSHGMPPEPAGAPDAAKSAPVTVRVPSPLKRTGRGTHYHLLLAVIAGHAVIEGLGGT
jgi:hypothetical protein